MYRAAERLNPDRYRRLARAVYAEMALAGITAVGEFHYVHHDSGGATYADPNAMGHAVIDGAADAGIRLTLLDTCYLSSAPDGSPLAGPQQRFGDGTGDGWAQRVEALRQQVDAQPAVLVGAATAFRPRSAYRAHACRRGMGCRAQRAAARPFVGADPRGRTVPRGARPHTDCGAARCRGVGPRSRRPCTPPT